MNVIFTILAAFLLGFAVQRRGLAIVTYLALDAIVFTFQTLSLILGWLAGTSTFVGPPSTSLPVRYSQSELWSYGVVNLVIMAAGVGLTILGTKVAARRTAKLSAVSVA